MPLQTWKSYATKVRKKPKSDFREYIRAQTLWVPREAEHCDSNEQSREVEKEATKEEEKIDPATFINGYLPPDVINSILEKQGSEVKLRPPTEVFEALDDAIDQHLERVHNGEKSKTRKRRKVQSSGSVSSEVGSIESSGSSSSDRPKKVRRKKDVQDGSSGPQEKVQIES